MPQLQNTLQLVLLLASDAKTLSNHLWLIQPLLSHIPHQEECPNTWASIIMSTRKAYLLVADGVGGSRSYEQRLRIYLASLNVL